MYARYPIVQIINVCGQFLDALISIYFLHKFFSPKKQNFQYLWIIIAVLMTILTQLGDYISENNVNLWQFLLLLIPFLYTFLFKQGSVHILSLIHISPSLGYKA